MLAATTQPTARNSLVLMVRSFFLANVVPDRLQD
jgi:hypothetical protein